jgi:hypothetical protein
MTSTNPDKLAPLATPVPPNPTDDLYTEAQWTTLMAIMDTVIPSIRRESEGENSISQLCIADVEYQKAADHIREKVTNAPSSAALDEYFQEKPSDLPEFLETIKRMLWFYVREDGRKGLSVVLSALK